VHVLEEKLHELKGKEVGVSDWFQVDQNRINQFAEATEDFQWIHVDTERAAREMPGGKTIGHGFLTLSLVAGLMSKVVRLPGVASSLNYGLNKVRFLNPVQVGSRVRLRAVLADWEKRDNGYLVTWQATVELEGADKPACVAEMLALTRPN